MRKFPDSSFGSTGGVKSSGVDYSAAFDNKDIKKLKPEEDDTAKVNGYTNNFYSQPPLFAYNNAPGDEGGFQA